MEIGKGPDLRTILSDVTRQRLADTKARTEASANNSMYVQSVDTSLNVQGHALTIRVSISQPRDTGFGSRSQTPTTNNVVPTLPSQVPRSSEMVTDVDDDGDELRYVMEHCTGKSKTVSINWFARYH